MKRGILPNCSYEKCQKEYFYYAVKEVFEQYYLQLADQINKTEIELLISQSDVTNKWKLAQKRQNNSIDCESKAFDLSKFLEN